MARLTSIAAPFQMLESVRYIDTTRFFLYTMSGFTMTEVSTEGAILVHARMTPVQTSFSVGLGTCQFTATFRATQLRLDSSALSFGFG